MPIVTPELDRVRRELEQLGQSAERGELGTAGQQRRAELTSKFGRLLGGQRVASDYDPPRVSAMSVQRRAQRDPRAYEDGLMRQAAGLRRALEEAKNQTPQRQRLLRLELMAVILHLEWMRLPPSERPSRRQRQKILAVRRRELQLKMARPAGSATQDPQVHFWGC